jgi:hypothetical protein
MRLVSHTVKQQSVFAVMHMDGFGHNMLAHDNVVAVPLNSHITENNSVILMAGAD